MSAFDSSITVDDDGTVTVFFDMESYSEGAVKKAAYKFADVCGIVLAKVEGKTRAQISFPGNEDESSQKRIVNAYVNEVLDQDLRETIAKETEGLRNLILAHAFSRTSLLEND